MDKRQRGLRVSLAGGTFGGRPVLEPVHRSRAKLITIAVVISLAVASAPWAATHYDEWTGDNEITPASSREQIVVLPGTAIGNRDGQQFTAAVGDEITLEIDLGEIAGGSSASFPDLVQLRNDGPDSLLVYVEAQKISEAPLHASAAGDEAPGAYRVDAGATKSVDLGLTADLLATPGDVIGALHLRSASGRYERDITTKLTVKPPSLETTLDNLLGANNPLAGLGKLNELVGGMVPPAFDVSGVQDGGSYAADVKISWKPVGPLAGVHGRLDGSPVGRDFTVRTEGDHTLKLDATLLGSVPFSKSYRFNIDKTPPSVILVSSSTQPAENANFAARADDSSQVTAVDIILERQPEQSAASPSPTPSPTASPSPAPSPTPSGHRRQASPSPSPSTGGPSPSPSAAPTPTPAPPPPPIRLHATKDPKTGLWVVQTTLPAGTYRVWAEAWDAVGNRQTSFDQFVNVVAVWPANVPKPSN